MAEMMASSAAAVAVRPDEDIHADVLEALWSNTQICTFERGNFTVEVSSGLVTLGGHIASSLLSEAAEELAASVPGVVAVENHMLADTDLAVAVGEALAANPEARPYYLRVDAFHGWINISGPVPNEAVQAAAEAAAVGVHGVRGVLGLPPVAGAAPAQVRRALQPPIGAAVYADDGPVGRVQFVVIDPRNRLVSHAGVLARFETLDRTFNDQILVPIDVVDAVSTGGIFLSVTQDQIADWAANSQDAGEMPPPDWEPPFPYSVGQTRWLSPVLA